MMHVSTYRFAGFLLALALAMALPVSGADEGTVIAVDLDEEIKEMIDEEIEEIEEESKEEGGKKKYHEDVVKVGESLVIKENEVVKGDVVCIGGTMRIAGKVEGDAVCIGGTMKLDSTAVIEGDAVAVGGSIKRHDDAVVEGESVSIGMPFIPGLLGLNVPCVPRHVSRASASPFPVLFGLFLFVLVIAVLVSAFLPRPTERLEATVRGSFWKSFLIGLLGEVLIFPLIMLLIVSVVGLALVPLAIIAIAAALYLGITGVSLLVGNIFFSKFRSKLPHIVGATAIGVVLIYALWIVGGLIAYGVGPLGGLVVALGSVVAWVAWTTGFGAVILTRFGSRLPADLEPESGGSLAETA
jgi:hypothetical protein